jgi:hypothetical protein
VVDGGEGGGGGSGDAALRRSLTVLVRINETGRTRDTPLTASKAFSDPPLTGKLPQSGAGFGAAGFEAAGLGGTGF